MESDFLTAIFWLSARTDALLDALYEHLCRFAVLYVFLIFAYYSFAVRYEFAINVSISLPGHLYLIERNALPERGDYVAFNYGSNFLYPKGTRFLKRVMGTVGDTVRSESHHFTVNGKAVGIALSTTSAGKPIEESSFSGAIPSGHYYVMADHPLSLDSRYAPVGLVSSNQIIGRAFKLF